jgi:hypothetical protein
MSDVLESTQAGWRPDPSGRYEWRYFDGGWTNRVANSVPAGTPTAPEPLEPMVQSVPEAVVPDPTPDPTPDPSPGPTPEIADPFAALRVPRGTAPTPAPASAPDLAPAPAPAPAPARAPAPNTQMVPTFASRHDGTSGTVWDEPYVPPGAPPHEDVLDERGATKGVLGFLRSFWEQPESYHSPKAGIELPPHPKHDQLEPPANYARAGLVMLAACGIAIGAYLPWISGTVGTSAFERTGYQMGHAWGFTWAAAAFVVAAMLGTRRRAMGWVTMGMAVVVAGLVARQLLLVHEQVQSLNTGQSVGANVGVGLWIMLASAAIGLVAAFRFDGSQQIV